MDTYEKKYKNALTIARSRFKIEKDESVLTCLEMMFPELSESEDERIMKALIKLLKEVEEDETYTGKQHIPEMLTYLEKQKEQKSLNISVASKWLRKNVCRYMNSEYNEFHKCVEYDGSIDKERLINDFEETMQKEQKPRDYCSVRDEFDLDGNLKQKPAEWSDADRHAIENCEYAIKETFKDEHNPHRIGTLDWLKSLHERFNLQPKQEWSDEDKKMLERAIHIIVEYSDIDEKESEIVQNWLKSLR